jgi:hypothetical protein
MKFTPSGYYKNNDSTQVFKTSLHSAGPNEDLALAVKLPGPLIIQYSFLLLIIAWAPGNSQSPHPIRNAFGGRTAIHQQIWLCSRYFEILFRVTGIDKTAYRTEMLIFNEIRKD